MNGLTLAGEISRSIAAEYGWPDYHPKIHVAVPVDDKILAGYVGSYEANPSFTMVITLENGGLVLRANQQPKFPLLAESETMFFPTALDAEIEFVKDESGKVTSLVLHQGGHDLKQC